VYSHAQAANQNADDNGIEELDPTAPNVEELLDNFDKAYEEQTGMPAHINDMMDDIIGQSGCMRGGCPVWVQVVKSTQTLYLYMNGNLTNSWAVSTGRPGYTTPDFDTHPDGRIYDRYSSDKFPGGDWNGLGNMPYAVFISGGYALHGTPQGNWANLGHVASHGCIRMLPDNAYIFNRLARQYGVRNVWVTVQ
jgi:hypothetical protein